MISGVIVHLQNELPVLVDLEALPEPGDRMVRCTNVRTVDGKRPSFVHDRQGTFIFPLETIRLIEAPHDGSRIVGVATDDSVPPQPAPVPEPEPDEEPDEDLLARIRSI